MERFAWLAVALALISGQPGSAMDAARAARLDAADPARPAGPGALQRGGADLLERGPPRARARAAAADAAPVAGRGRPRPQHGAAQDPQPRAAGPRPGGPVAADAPPVAAVPHGGGEHRHGQGVPPARPADRGRHDGCSFTYGDTRQPVPVHTYASLARRRWSPLAGLAEAPGSRCSTPGYQRLGAGVGVDPTGPACGDFYLVQDFADWKAAGAGSGIQLARPRPSAPAGAGRDDRSVVFRARRANIGLGSSAACEPAGRWIEEVVPSAAVRRSGATSRARLVRVWK